MKNYRVTLTAEVDIDLDANSPEEAIENLRARFDRSLYTDELEGTKLPKGGVLMGIKAEDYSAVEN